MQHCCNNCIVDSQSTTVPPRPAHTAPLCKVLVVITFCFTRVEVFCSTTFFKQQRGTSYYFVFLLPQLPHTSLQLFLLLQLLSCRVVAYASGTVGRVCVCKIKFMRDFYCCFVCALNNAYVC